MTKIDKNLKNEDHYRKEVCKEAIESLIEEGLPEWKGFSDTEKVLCVRGGSGQVHVGDVFRIFPTFEYLKSQGIRIVLATSPGVEKMFSSWKETARILDGSRQPDEIMNDFREEKVAAYVKWASLLRAWRKVLKSEFDEAANPAVRSDHLSVPNDMAITIRRRYSGDGKKVLGIIWRTSMIGRDPDRNASLREFLPFLELNSNKWNIVSLQYGSLAVTGEEVSKFNEKNGTKIIFDPSIDPMRDYVSASAQMAACDHIVSIDCSQVFQAGACGVPVSVLLDSSPNKQWLEEKAGTICPFFPETGKVFYQKKSGEWSYPIEQALEHIKEDVRQRGGWEHPAAQRIKRSLQV